MRRWCGHEQNKLRVIYWHPYIPGPRVCGSSPYVTIFLLIFAAPPIILLFFIFIFILYPSKCVLLTFISYICNNHLEHERKTLLCFRHFHNAFSFEKSRYSPRVRFGSKGGKRGRLQYFVYTVTILYTGSVFLYTYRVNNGTAWITVREYLYNNIIQYNV